MRGGKKTYNTLVQQYHKSLKRGDREAELREILHLLPLEGTQSYINSRLWPGDALTSIYPFIIDNLRLIENHG